MKEPQLITLVPTRNYRKSLDSLIKSWDKTTEDIQFPNYGLEFHNKKYSELVIIIDRDQEELYAPLLETITMGVNYLILNETLPLAEKLNKATSLLMSGELGTSAPLAIGYVGDDCLFETEGWEKEVREKLISTEGIVYCNDLLKGEEVPNNVFIHGGIIEKIGFMCPPGLKHYYIDNYWKDLGLRTHKIFYFDDLVIEHLHHGNGKAEKDALHISSEKYLLEDRKVYDEYVTSGKLAEDAKKVLA